MILNNCTYQQKVGFTYEYYVLDKIKNEYDKIWHWRDFPEKLLYDNNVIKDYTTFCKYRYDMGADLVAFKDNKYYFIQCKNFKDNPICINDLGGFYFLLHEYGLNGILYYNGRLSQRLIELSTNKIGFVNMTFNNENIGVEKIEPINFIPKDYQLEAYNKLKDKNCSVLSLPCGMGKSYTSSLISKNHKNTIILSPLRYLAVQTLDNFKQYLGKDYNYLLVSMDGNRKIEELKGHLKDKNIISATYDSVDVIFQLIDSLTDVFIIIDEFHNLSDNNINNKETDYYKIINSDHKKLFMSATHLPIL